MSTTTLSVRIDPENPNHHLFDNHGTWWCHLTIHRDDGTKERQRQSLHTRDVVEARQRRDRLFALYRKNCETQGLTCHLTSSGVVILESPLPPDDPLFTGGWRFCSARARTPSTPELAGEVQP